MLSHRKLPLCEARSTRMRARTGLSTLVHRHCNILHFVSHAVQWILTSEHLNAYLAGLVI